ncbi:hypothetical protein HDZ31DRAFT_32306 [Schizophyllum fasciatum]
MASSAKAQQNGHEQDDIEFLSAPTRIARGRGKTGRAPIFATNQQMLALHAAYEESSFIQSNRLKALARSTGLTEKWIALWFQRQRRKARGVKAGNDADPSTDVKQEDEVPPVTPTSASAPVKARRRRKSKKTIEDSDDEEQSVADSGLVKAEQEEALATVVPKPPTLRIRLPALKRLPPPAVHDPHSEVMMVVDPQQPVTEPSASQPNASFTRRRSGSIIDFGDAGVDPSSMAGPSEPQCPSPTSNQQPPPSASRPSSAQAPTLLPRYEAPFDNAGVMPPTVPFIPPPAQQLDSPVPIPSSPSASSSSGSEDSDLAYAPPMLASSAHARALQAGEPVPADVAAQPAYQFTDPAQLQALYVDMYSRSGPAPLDLLAPPHKRPRLAYSHLAKYPSRAHEEKEGPRGSYLKEEPSEGSLMPLASTSSAGTSPLPSMLPPAPPPLPGGDAVTAAPATPDDAAGPTAREPSEEIQLLEHPDSSTPPPPPTPSSLSPFPATHSSGAPQSTPLVDVKVEPGLPSDIPALRPANFQVNRAHHGAQPWRPSSRQSSRQPSTSVVPVEDVDEDSPAALLKQLNVLRVTDDNAAANSADANEPHGCEYITDREEILRRLLDPALAERDPIQAAMGLVFLARVGLQDI